MKKSISALSIPANKRHGKGTRTAREVIELSSEKMSQMGPLLESLQDYLNMIVERVMDICFRAGVYPPPPPEIQGMEMDVEFTSILAQAQKQQSLTPITDTVQSAIAMASGSGDMSILDKIDFDEVVDQVGGLNGSPPSIIRSDEIGAQIRAQRQQAPTNLVSALSPLISACEALFALSIPCCNACIC